MNPNTEPEPVALPRPAERYERQEVTLTREEVRQYNAAIHQRVATLGNLRAQVAFFRCPWPCTRTQYDRRRKAAIDKWVARMEFDGWQLASAVRDYPQKRRTAHAMTGDWYAVPVLDEVEIPVAAAFRKLDMKIVRTAVPVSD